MKSLQASSRLGQLRQGLALTVASVVLFGLSMPGRPLPWLAWVACVPFFCALRVANSRNGLFLAAAFGWLTWYSSVWWLNAPLRDILGLSPALSVLVVSGGCALFAIPQALAGWTVTAWQRQSGLQGAVRDALIFTGLTSWLSLIFHGNIAHSQYAYPVMLQVLDLGGTPLLLFAVYLVNWLVAESILNWRRNRPTALRTATTAITALGCIIGYGTVRLTQAASEEKAAPSEAWFTAGAVQPNIPIPVPDHRQPDPSAIGNNFFTAMAQAKDLARQHPEIELLVLPETTDFFLFDRDQKRRAALAEMLTYTHKPAILNASQLLNDPARCAPGETGRFNTTFFLNADSRVAGCYRKTQLVPLIESLPSQRWLLWLRHLLPRSQHLTPGGEPTIFDVRPGVRVIPLICYEGTFSAFTRRFILQGGNVIVNQANDGWFLHTPASELHLALALFRTVEFRVPMIRVTNTGAGAFVQADGRIVPASRTPLFVKTQGAFPLFIPTKRSFYAKYGDWFLLLCAIGLPFFGIVGSNRSSLRKKPVRDRA